MKPSNAALLGGVFALLLVVLLGASPKLTTYVGQFYGDGTGMSNVTTSGNADYVPFKWTSVSPPVTNTWTWDDPDNAFNFDGNLRAANLELTQGLLVDQGSLAQVYTTGDQGNTWRWQGRDLFNTTFSGSSAFMQFHDGATPWVTFLGGANFTSVTNSALSPSSLAGTDAHTPPKMISGSLSGDVTSSGFVATLKSTGTAGTYTKTTFDAQGRETSGTSAVLASSDFANQGTTVTVLHGNASGNPSFGAVALGTDVSGTLQAAQFPALTGDITTSAGSLATAMKSTGTAGTYYKTTFDAQGRETSGITTVAMADIVQPGLIHTNGYAASNPTASFSNNVSIDAAHQLILSNVSTAKVLISRADSGVTNSGLGAVPINGDTTATTSAQVQALFPGAIMTNGYASGNPTMVASNKFAVDAAHAFYPSNATPSRLAMIGPEGALTNAGAASAAAPANLDGSATTMSQIAALAPLIFAQTLGGSDANLNPISGTTKYITPFASPQNDGAVTEGNAWQVFRGKGYFTNFYLTENGLQVSTNVTFTFMLNSSATTLLISINGTGAATIGGFDETHSFATTGSSNNVSIRMTANNPSTVQMRANWTVQFVSQP